MTRWLVVIAILIGPYLVLLSPDVPQALGRTIAVSIWAFCAPVAIFWFGLKSQMIRPGGKLHQPQFDDVRPKIERNLRILVIAFGIFYFFILTVPFAEDLIQLANSQRLLRIKEEVKYRRFGRGPMQSIGLSHSDRNYYLFYATKLLRVGGTYEFVVLPRSHVLLDYAEVKR
jgi:hypothetical protein